MAKMWSGLAILVVLFIGTLFNTAYMERKVGEIMVCVDEVEYIASQKKYAPAADKLREAIDMWNEMDDYTHIFIRHSEIDSTSDAFYELLSQLNIDEPGGIPGALDKLRYHLDIMMKMERMSFGSVF